MALLARSGLELRLSAALPDLGERGCCAPVACTDLIRADPALVPLIESLAAWGQLFVRRQAALRGDCYCPRTSRIGAQRGHRHPRRTNAHLRTHVAPGPQAILFPSLRGSGYARNTALTRLLTAAQDAAGIEIPDGHSGGWHALRHYSATRYGQAGATTRALMTRYGWPDPAMAARYQRSDEDFEREIVARMAERQADSLRG